MLSAGFQLQRLDGKRDIRGAADVEQEPTKQRVRGTDGRSRAESQEQRVGRWAAGKAATET